MLELQLHSSTEDEDGKESVNYLIKKLLELRVAEGKGEEEGRLVAEVDELVRLSNKTCFFEL